MFGIKKKEQKSIETTVLFATLEEMNNEMNKKLNKQMAECYSRQNLKYGPVVINR